MDKKIDETKKEIEETKKPEGEGEIKNTELPEHGRIWKAGRWVLSGIACVASGLLGFFIGKGKRDNDDEDEDCTSTETPDE